MPKLKKIAHGSCFEHCGQVPRPCELTTSPYIVYKVSHQLDGDVNGEDKSVEIP